METLFVLTHAVMLICLLSIVYISIANLNDNVSWKKPSVISVLLTKVKSVQINTIYISRTVAALLTFFLR